MGRGARIVSLVTAVALLAAVSIPVASGASDSPAAAAKKKCKGKSAAAAKKGKCKKGKRPARTPAALTITPPSYDFGVTPVPQTQGTRFVVSNKGGSPSGVPSVTLQDASSVPGAMSINTNGCTQAIPNGGTCAITVNYNSSVVNLQGRATLTVSASPGGSASATINGST